jgi:hypothetical protein
MTHTIRPLALLGAISLAACASGVNAGSPDASGPGSDASGPGSDASSGGLWDSGGGASSGGSASGASSSGGATGSGASASGASSSGGGTSSGASSSGGGSSGGGDSGPSSGGADGGSSSGSDGGAALVNHAPGSKFFVGANFWNIDWEGQADFFTSNVDFTTTTNPWQPALLTDLAPYAVLRFMDWNQTNTSSNAQAVWSTRKQKTQPQNEPVAFEWQIDLCNRTKKDYWLNIPHEAAPDYWPKLA